MNTARHYTISEYLEDEQATQDLGKRLAILLQEYVLGGQSVVISLDGNLGAGKTTLVRACLRALGVEGAIKSPTYTLLEPYQVPLDGSERCLRIAHLDLYRLQEPEELAYLGARRLTDDYDLTFVEWPEQGVGYLPFEDLKIQLNHKDRGRSVTLLSTDALDINKLNDIKNK